MFKNNETINILILTINVYYVNLRRSRYVRIIKLISYGEELDRSITIILLKVWYIYFFFFLINCNHAYKSNIVYYYRTKWIPTVD